MKNGKKTFLSLLKNKLFLLCLLILLLIILLFIYYNLIFKEIIKRNEFANEAITISAANKNPIFKISRIFLYSSADIVDNTEGQTLQDVNIHQFTDIAIEIDNRCYETELTAQNTVKELYIDNIKIEKNSDIGNSYINYKNPYKFAKFQNFAILEDDKISYTILKTNEENNSNDYSNPTFYTDCSNPLTLGYLNKDIVTNYAVQQNSEAISYNGKVLEQTNINLNDIGYTLSFSIHLKNNLDENFIYNMKINVDLNTSSGGLYNGYLFQGKDTSGRMYDFFKQVNL